MVGRSSTQSRILGLSLTAWAASIVACAPGPVTVGPTGGGGQPIAKTQQREAQGALVGRVTRGPLSPVEGVGAARSALPGAMIIISTPDGQEVASATTDAQGVYRMNLPLGTYRVTMAPLGGMEFSKDLPATVTIIRGRETRLDLRIDTGIR